MNIGLYQSAASLQALERWQETVAHNVAAGSVPGYKRAEIEFSAAPAGRTRTDPADALTDERRALAPRARGEINFEQGELRATGRDLDFALQGNGFFQVRGADGRMSYTRNGEFHLGPDLALLTGRGEAVMGEGGAPLVLKPGGGRVTVDADGNVFQGDSSVGKLAVYDFADPRRLQVLADGAFRPAGNQAPRAVEKPVVAAGYTEASNVNALRSMVDLVAVSRAYEIGQRLVTQHDDMLGQAIQTLGNPQA